MRLAPLALALAACAHAAPAAPEPPAAGAAPGERGGARPPAPPRRPAAPLQPAEPRPPASPAGTVSSGDEPFRPAGPGDAGPASARERLVAAARRYLGRLWRGDCSDFVERVHAEAGVRLSPLPAHSASEGLWRVSRRVERPRPGDLAFFHDTFDRNGDGRPGDRFTHVALVEAVQGPHVVLIHRGSRGIARLFMNLSRRHDSAENSWLRRRRPNDPPGLRYLAGELFTGYATTVPAQSARR